MRTFAVGSRQSALALTQTNQVVDMLRSICREHGLDYEFEVRKIVTKGDRILDVSLSKVGGKGLFVKEIEQALLDGEIDMAVHSMKDLPSELPDGLVIGAIPARVDPRDCLISNGDLPLSELPRHARIGTSSLRRACQLKAYRPDFRLEAIRGNIDSRFRKLSDQGLDGIILAAAGIRRMGWQDRISEALPPEICLPAVGQGALGIECRKDRKAVLDLLSKLNDAETEWAVTAERGFLHRLNGGCQVPIGAHAVLMRPNGGRPDLPEIHLTGMVGSPDGKEMLKQTMIGKNPYQLGIALAEQLIESGASRILDQARG